MDFDDFDGLPTGDTEFLTSVVTRFKLIVESDPDRYNDTYERLQTFFMEVLTPYYDCMWDGMDTMVGHFVYRLSDFVDPAMRSRIYVYPMGEWGRESGKYEGVSVADSGELDIWYSLNDFRKDWKHGHAGNIPDLPIKMLPAAELALGQPICEVCTKVITSADVQEFNTENSPGWPCCCSSCAATEAYVRD